MVEVSQFPSKVILFGEFQSQFKLPKVYKTIRLMFYSPAFEVMKAQIIFEQLQERAKDRKAYSEDLCLIER